jgi:hypothetical protein
LLAFLEQAQAFADHFAGGLIPSGGDARLDELPPFRCERDILKPRTRVRRNRDLSRKKGPLLLNKS